MADNVIIPVAGNLFQDFPTANINVFNFILSGSSLVGGLSCLIFGKLMPDKAKNILFAITSWISTFTLGMMTYASFTYAITMKKVSAMLLVPYKPFVFIMSICAFAFALALLSDAVKATLAIRNEELAKEIASELS